MDLTSRRHWIFDMDGTLTVPMHDFAALRIRLGIPEGEDILAHIEARPRAEAADARRVVDAWELALADRAQPQADALRLLRALARAGCRVGVLTRNTQAGARRTLAAAGLTDFFDPIDVLGRDDAPPKPSPAGVLRLLTTWGAEPGDAVMVGDWIHDTAAGRAAGTATVLIDRGAPAPHTDTADLRVTTLDAIPRP